MGDQRQVRVHESLKDRFGFDDFLPGQEEAITLLLNGHSTAVVFPTGGGKSICYQLPSTILDGLTIVVSPLIALMKDQIDALMAKSISAARLDSTLTADEYRNVLDRIRNGGLKMLYVAPERFNNERFRTVIQNVPISLIAVDESHCISEWGHNFRPDYLKLAEYIRLIKAERTLALTATATADVLADICREFGIKSEHAIVTPFYRPNLTLLSCAISKEQRDVLLMEKLKSRELGSTIVYVTLQKTAERVAKTLADAGFSAKAYHAGMKDEDRADAQDWFMNNNRAIVVATIAFGMGIDKANIRYVYHYNLPKSIENYAQEIGRAGRDGKPSTCEMMVCPDDLNPLENFIFGDTPTKSSIAILFEKLFHGPAQQDFSFYELSSASDIRLLVVKTLVTYLELDGYLRCGTPFYSNYQFIPLRSSQDILSAFDGERRDFLANVFLKSKKAKKWFSIDLDSVAAELSCGRDRIVRALDYLSEQSMIELRASGVRQMFKRLKKPKSPEDWIDQLHHRMVDREARDLKRLNQVLAWAFAESCQTSNLGAYFGQPLDQNCGHCAYCLGIQRVPFDREPAMQLNPETWRRCLEARNQHEILRDRHRFACWVCGITLPALSKAKLTANPLFGCLDSIPFREIAEKLES